MKEEQLIFIISQPRSGSTYLQNLLSNNAEVNTCSESWMLLNFANQIKPALVQSKFDNTLAVGAFKEYLGKYPNFNFREAFHDFLLKLYSPMFEGYQFVVDKTPRYWEIASEITTLFPGSKVIVLHRNPIDVAKSMIKTWGFTSFKELNMFRRDLLQGPEKLRSFSIANKDNKNVYNLSYEDLINDTPNEVQKLYNWIGIPYDASVLDTQKNDKYKGGYGDPFQNADVNYKTVKARTDEKGINKDFKDFLNGYANYLGTDIQKEYNGFQNKAIKNTTAFNYFMHLGDVAAESKKRRSIIWLLKKHLYELRFK